METKLIKKYETRLEYAVKNGDSIQEILDNKLSYYQDNNMPAEESMADYIALGISGQKSKIEQYKQYKKDLDSAIQAMEELERETSTQIVRWMDENGLIKLKGIHCSSITSKAATVSITTKTVRDISDAELLEKGFAHQVEIIRDIPASVRINKRKTS